MCLNLIIFTEIIPYTLAKIKVSHSKKVLFRAFVSFFRLCQYDIDKVVLNNGILTASS